MERWQSLVECTALEMRRTEQNEVKHMKFEYKDKVVVTDPKYAYIAEVGTVGEIVNDGSRCEGGAERYLVRWESTPTMLWGVDDSSIEALEE